MSEQSKPPIYFCIPLRGKATTQSWSRVCGLLEETLTSVFAQEDSEVEAIVACHDLPDTAFRGEPRVTFLQTDRAIPANPAEQMLDKSHKKIMAGEEVCRRGGGYMVILDADDLVSNRLASFIRATDNRRGYLFNVGYRFDARTRRIWRLEGFDEHCGSCAAFHVIPEDLLGTSGLIREIGQARHADFGDLAARVGRPLDPVPFPAVIYRENHGENHSAIGHRRSPFSGLRNQAHRLANTWIASRRVPGTVMSEFSLA